MIYMGGYTYSGAPYRVTWEQMGMELWRDAEENFLVDSD